MDSLALFNSLEAVFWMVVAATVFVKSRSNPVDSRLGQIAAIWFFLFGVSDVFEVYTGAWWRPLSLLLLKAACVTALIVCGIVYRQRYRRQRRQPAEVTRPVSVPKGEI